MVFKMQKNANISLDIQKFSGYNNYRKQKSSMSGKHQGFSYVLLKLVISECFR